MDRNRRVEYVKVEMCCLIKALRNVTDVEESESDLLAQEQVQVKRGPQLNATTALACRVSRCDRWPPGDIRLGALQLKLLEARSVDTNRSIDKVNESCRGTCVFILTPSSGALDVWRVKARCSRFTLDVMLSRIRISIDIHLMARFSGLSSELDPAWSKVLTTHLIRLARRPRPACLVPHFHLADYCMYRTVERT